LRKKNFQSLISRYKTQQLVTSPCTVSCAWASTKSCWLDARHV